MADHVRILRTYLAHLRCKAPTQSTRPRWCDVHAALEDAIRVMSEPATQPPAVGVDVSDEMVNLGADELCECWSEHENGSSEFVFDAVARRILNAALRTGGGES